MPPGIAIPEMRNESDPKTIVRINFLSSGNSSHTQENQPLILRQFTSIISYILKQREKEVPKTVSALIYDLYLFQMELVVSAVTSPPSLSSLHLCCCLLVLYWDGFPAQLTEKESLHSALESFSVLGPVGMNSVDFSVSFVQVQLPMTLPWCSGAGGKRLFIPQ